jgi:hypothetical protein
MPGLAHVPLHFVDGAQVALARAAGVGVVDKLTLRTGLYMANQPLLYQPATETWGEDFAQFGFAHGKTAVGGGSVTAVKQFGGQRLAGAGDLQQTERFLHAITTTLGASEQFDGQLLAIEQWRIWHGDFPRGVADAGRL